MPSTALVTQLFSSLMRVYRTFPPVAPIITIGPMIAEVNAVSFGLVLAAGGVQKRPGPDQARSSQANSLHSLSVISFFVRS
jgi:hypothetical protein